MKRLALLLLFLPMTAGAWTIGADQRIARKAAALAPPDMRLVLQKLESEYQSGLLKGQSEEGNGTHVSQGGSVSGKLRERIESESAAVIRMIRKRDPMPMVAERLGVIAHLVGDANNPFHVGRGDPRLAGAQPDFEAYFEREMVKFPTVFYGLDEQRAPRPLIDATIARTRQYYRLLGDEYSRDGEPHTSADFDERSSAFGVAAICYSHAVTDLVNLYYYIWREAGGDVRAARAMRKGNLLLTQ